MTIYEQLLINIKYYNSIHKFKDTFNEYTTCEGTALYQSFMQTTK